MASLSNINGLFDVHSTGAILFSTSHGLNGQILRSNGDAAPTWIDFSSTGFGGDYLLLTGGVLTGNLTINGTNNLTVGGTVGITGALSGSTGTFTGSGTILSLNRNAPGTSLIELKTANTIRGKLGATTTKSLVVYSDVTENAHVENNGNIGLYGSAINFLIGGPGGINFRESGTITIDSDNNQSSRNFQFKDGDGSSLMFIGDTGMVNIGGTSGNASRLNIIGDTTTSVGYNQMNIANAVGDWGMLLGFGNGVATGGYHGLNHAAIINVQSAPLHLGTSNSAKLTILANGNIGIGTTSPFTKLHVQNPNKIDDIYGLVLVENTSTGTGGVNSAVNVKSYYGTSQFMQWEANGLRIGSRILTNSGVGDVYFTAGADSVKMVIKANGNVGIGTTSPNNFTNQTSLTVSGTSIGRVDVQVTAGGGGGIYGSSSQMKMFSNYGMNLALESGTGGITTFATNGTERMRITAGGSVTIPLSTAGSVVQINTTSTAGTLNVGGKIFAAQNNSNTAAMRITRTVSIPHGSNAGNFTFDFDPVAIWGFSVTGGHVEINVAGWSQRLNAGFIQFQNNGGGAPLTVAIFVQTAVNGNGTISVQVPNPGVSNTIRITFANWHSNAHAWNAWISSPQS